VIVVVVVEGEVVDVGVVVTVVVVVGIVVVVVVVDMVVVVVVVEAVYWKAIVPVAPLESVAVMTYVPVVQDEPPMCVG